MEVNSHWKQVRPTPTTLRHSEESEELLQYPGQDNKKRIVTPQSKPQSAKLVLEHGVHCGQSAPCTEVQ